MKMKLIKRQLFFAVFFLFTNWATAQDYGNFPYFQPFNSGVKPSDVTIPSNSDAVTFTSNGMILTPSQNTRFGAAYLNNIRFYSPQGIRLEFEYGMYGGTGADGLSVFLFDAAVTNPQIGARGDALAYNYNRANDRHPTTRQAGLTGAYLGIGLDAYGNFKNRVFQGERRKNGFGGSLSVSDNQISLRGAAGKTNLGSDGRGIGFNGYPLLATKSTRSGTTAGAILNNDGTFTTTAGTTANFNLGTTALGLTPTDTNFRKAYIDLLPNVLGGYNVTVKIQHGATTTTIIDNFHYKTSLTYVENANPNSTDFSNDESSGANSTHVLNAAIPEYFRIGFGASTGAFNNIHSIRNLKIMIPYAAEAYDDTFNLTCAANSNSINVLANDLAYTNFSAPTASTNNIYKPSFRFLNASGVPQGHTYNDPAVGTWSYDQLTGIVSLSPIAGFSGDATVQYDIKGGGPTGTETPFDKDAYISAPATITANVAAVAAAPSVVSTLSNNCLTGSTTVNLNDAFIGTVPTNLVWFNNNLHSGTALTASEIANAVAGTYYAFLYNSVTSCYSAAAPVVVSIYPCASCGVMQRASFPNSGGNVSSSTYLNNNVIGIGTSRITVVNTVTGSAVIGSAPTYNGISNGHYQSEPGIRIGKEQPNGVGAINASNTIKTAVNFSKPVNDLSFRLHDLDWGDNVTVNAYNELGALVTLGASNYFIHNTANITKTGNRFHEVASNPLEILNNTRGGTVDISYSGMTISRVEFIFYDTRDAGTYTIAEFKGIIPCEACYKPAATGGTVLSTNHGITALGRAGKDVGNWPMIRKGAWTALEAKTKGFVINRISTTALVEAIANPKEGMMVYDEEADCLKINTTGTSTGWKCFNVQGCPDGSTS